MKFKIGRNDIGDNSPVFIIAEMSGNHGGSLEEAVKIVRAAKEAGADAVKLQTYTADTITLNSDKADFKLPSNNPWSNHSNLYQLFQKAFTPWEWHPILFEEAKQCGVEIFSSPFDLSAVDFLEKLKAPAYKIASPEITDVGLIEKVARTKKPVILSTGAAELNDIELAVKTIQEAGCDSFAFLKCVASYPSPPEAMNLKTIPHLAEMFNCVSGLSDHSLGIGIPVAAVALGAKLIEKHFVLNKKDTVDGFFSLDKESFTQMVIEIRKVEKAIGKVSYQIDEEGKKNFWGRRSLYFSDTIKKDDVISENNIRSVRPSFGLHPKFKKEILGKKALENHELGDRIHAKDIDWDS